MTRVLKMGREEGQALEEKLRDEGFEFGPLAYAFFQAKGQQVVVSLYESGKLVVQGKGTRAFLARFLPDLSREPNPSNDSPEGEGAGIGSDETGKGDTFGGMVVAGVAVPESGIFELREAGVADSKTMNDRRIRILAPWIESNLATRVRVLSPSEYNRMHAESGNNVNRLLTELHSEIVESLVEETGLSRVVVDRFGSDLPVTRRLREKHPELEILEIPRAEAHACVAAASVLARSGFLDSMAELSQEWAVDFPLGSGSPVPPAMNAFLDLHGPEAMRKVAKLHFRNVRKRLEK